MKEIKPVSTPEDALTKVRDYLAIDSETNSFDEATPVPPLITLQAYVDHQLYLLNYWNARGFFRDLLRYSLQTNRPITAHHACFDTNALLLNDPSCLDELIECYDRGLIEDSLLCEKLNDIARGQYDNDNKGRWHHSQKLGKRTLYYYGLSHSCEIRFGFPIAKDEAIRHQFGQFRETPVDQIPQRFRDYALIDVQAHYHLRTQQDADERRNPAREGFYVFADAAAQARAGFALQLCRWIGVPTDPQLTQAVKLKLRDRQAVVMERLYQLGFVRRPHWMPKAKRWTDPSTNETLVKTKLLEAAHRKGVTPKITEGAEKRGVNPAHATIHDVSIDKEALDIIDDPDLKNLSEFKKTQKLLGYTTILEKGFVHPIHSEPNTLVANGRISWGSDSPDGAGTDEGSVNLTNLPKEPGIRECYIPPTDKGEPCWLWAIDYAQLEMCAFAQACLWLVGHSLMADLINAGVDLHTRLSLMFLEAKGVKVTIEQFESLRNTEDVIYNGLTAEKIRDAAKRTNFGFLGGMGVDRFMSQNRDLKIERPDVQLLMKQLIPMAYPESKDYFKLASNISESSNPQIVQLTSGRIRGGLHYCDTANTFFSGLAADGGKESLYLIQRECFFDPTSVLFGNAAVFAFVHDENVGWAKASVAHECVERAEYIQRQTMQRRIPDVVIRTSRALSLRWRKGAKEHRDQNKRLIPFEYSPKFAELVAKGKMVAEPSLMVAA